MKKKIIVAGAGHGGVVAATVLAKNGFDVTVYEQNEKENIGFDWHDTFRIACFEEAGIPLPAKENYKTPYPLSFINPSKTVRISLPDTNGDTNCSMDRKLLISHLINNAQANGVKFRFGCEISGIIATNDRIQGITLARASKTDAVFADLIIDSAGIDSPVRRLLPNKFMIENDMQKDSIFTVHRAYLERISAENPPKPYTVYLFHKGTPGISWVIAHEEYFDVLIGRFGEELTQDDIESALSDIKTDNPSIGDKILRGNRVERIPLGRTLPLIVTDGYAAVGDSASMTIPIMGSGIANSIRAGKILADTVIADTDGLFTAKTLWQYQYDYFTKIGNNLVIADKLRELATQITAEDIDYALEKELLSQKDIDFGFTGEFNVMYILQKVIKALPKLTKLTNAAITLSKYGTIKKILSEIPEKYEKEQVVEWMRKYKEI